MLCQCRNPGGHTGCFVVAAETLKESEGLGEVVLFLHTCQRELEVNVLHGMLAVYNTAVKFYYRLSDSGCFRH